MKLSKEKLFLAVEKSLINARELHTDAKILKENNRLARAYTCFQFCIEEIGKASLTYQYLLDDDNSKLDKFLKNFRDHKTKTKTAIGIDTLVMKILESPDLKKKIIINSHIQSENITDFNNHKNYSLYTSFIKDEIYLPSEIITEKKLDQLEFYATIRLEVATKFYQIGLQEFDGVLIEHKKLDKDEMINEMVAELKQILN